MITNLLKINSSDVTKLTEYEVEYNTLWADAGRNMAGDLRSTFIGNFPKINVTFNHLTREQATTIVNLLTTNSSFTVEWYDVASNTLKSGTFYRNDFKVPILSKKRELFKPFSVSFISFNKSS